MTTGAGDSAPVDLRSLRATDALFDRLADRGAADSADPAVRLLGALVEDVSVQEGTEGARPSAGQPVPAVRRSGGSLGVRAAVAVGFASAMLAATGMAAGWEQGEAQQPGHSAGAGIKGGPAMPEAGQERPPDSRPSSLSITPST